LASNLIFDIEIDSKGNKLIGTDLGISKFNDTTWTTYTTKDGLVSNRVYKIYFDSNGNKWFGTEGGVSKFEDGVVGSNILELDKTNTIFSYPNPAINETTVLFPTNDKYSLTVTNINGKLISHLTSTFGKSTNLKTENMKSGLYLLSLKNLSNSNTYNGELMILK